MLAIVNHLQALYEVAQVIGLRSYENHVRGTMPQLVATLDELNFSFELEKPMLHSPTVIAYHSKIAGFDGAVQVRLKGDHFTIQIVLK